MAVTSIKYNYCSAAKPRRKPKEGDLKYVKGRDRWFVRWQARHDGCLVVKDGRPVWEWEQICESLAMHLAIKEKRHVIGWSPRSKK